MSIPAHPGRAFFVNIPVADLEASKAFFATLGFTFNPLFESEDGACMLIGEQSFAMLLTREKFAEFSLLPVGDPTKEALSLYAFGVESREDVDTVGLAALAAGGREVHGPEDLGFMYSRAFYDLDGHGWQVMWMDPAAAEQGPAEFAASAQEASA
jgi:predicted lactoylglutathione lyase